MTRTAAMLLGALLVCLAAAPAAASVSMIPFPFFFYTPETETAFGATLLTYLHGDDPDVRPSRLTPIFIRTAKKQTIAFLQAELYLDGERWRIGAETGYSKYPNTFWGVGNDTPDAAEEDYTSRTTLANLSCERLIAPALYVGVRFGYAKRRLLETEAGRLLATAAVPGARDGEVVTAGASISRDTRDDTTFPRAGGLRSLAFGVSGGALGGDYSYRSLSLNLADYRATSPTSVLALQLAADARSGDPPFDLLPQLGGDRLLRGYYAGRWRDRNLVAAQAEWRTHLWRRVGGVLFAGAGRVARDLGDFSFDGIHAAGGFGLRFLMSANEGLNLRMDWGFGSDSSGFYLNLGESF